MPTDHGTTALVDLAARHGLVLEPEHLTVEEAGLDFRVVFARTSEGQDWVLRAPRRDLTATIGTEERILRFVRTVLTAAVPDWRVVSPDLVAYPLLPGSPGLTLDEAGAPVWHYDVASPTFARSFGQVVSELHGASVPDAAAAGVPVRDPAALRQEFADQLERTTEEFDVSPGLLERWRRRLDDDGLWPEHPVLTHGELYPAHLLLDDAGTILSVLDWTTARVGDPAADFAYQHMIAPPAAFDLTVRTYAESHVVPPRLAERCAEIIAAAPVTYAVFALETGRPEHRVAAQAQLRPG